MKLTKFMHVYDSETQKRERKKLTDFHVPLLATPVWIFAWISRQSDNDGPHCCENFPITGLCHFNWTIFLLFLIYEELFCFYFKDTELSTVCIKRYSKSLSLENMKCTEHAKQSDIN